MLKKAVTLEFRRAVRGRGIALSIFICCAIIVANYFLNTSQRADYNTLLVNTTQPFVGPNSVYNGWIGFNMTMSVGAFLFVIFPLLAVLPYSLSLLEDKQTGFDIQIRTRITSSVYYISKIIVSFLFGGFICVFPLFFDFCVTGLFLPHMKPVVSLQVFAISARALFGELFFNHPLAYIAISLIVVFFIGGLISSVTLIFGALIKRKSILLALPVVVLWIIDFILYNHGKWSLIQYLNPGQSAPLAISSFVILYLAIAVSLGAVVAWRIRADEVV